MASKTPEQKPSTSAQALDLLLDALIERQAARAQGQSRPTPAEQAAPPPAPAEAKAPPSPEQGKRPARLAEPQPGEEGWQPPPKLPSIHLDRVLTRFLVLIMLLVVAVNVPLGRYGVSLAHIMPDSAALVIRDGLVLKGSGAEIYILQHNKLRWISSLNAFEHLGLRWAEVHVVEDSFLAGFEKGRPIHVLLKCEESPHIYRLENEQKRWIRDIDAFLAEGHVWEDVRFVTCDYLRTIPDGPPIPEDAGPPPQP